MLQGDSIVVLLALKQHLRESKTAIPELIKENLNVTNCGYNGLGLLYRVEPKEEQVIGAFHAEVENVMEVTGCIEWF